MKYGSVCSGIESATLAWEQLGWTPAFFSETDAFPRAVLTERWPHVPLHGDFTTIKGDEYGPVDLLVGGTPCQDFSIAGLRAGIAGDRGKLTLEFIRLAERMRPRWIVWENVPGVLSVDDGRAFGAFLGGLAFIGYGFAYRILDAQYFGLAQRRERVFVVGHLGDWRRAAAVLFERESLRWDSPPRREARQRVASALDARSGNGGFPGTDGACDVPVAFGGNTTGPIDIATAVNAHGRLDFESETFIAFTCKNHGQDASAMSETLRSMNEVNGNANAGGQVAVAFNITPSNSNKDYNALRSERAQAVTTAGNRPSAYGVRRLMPIECERLQGQPDGHTLVTYRGKPAADGPRYKAIGNGMAVTVMRWLGERIAMVDAL